MKLLYRHDLSPRNSVRALSMADFMVECEILLLNIYCLYSEVRLTLESEKCVKLQEEIKELAGLFLFLGTGWGKKSLSTRDLTGSL